MESISVATSPILYHDRSLTLHHTLPATFPLLNILQIQRSQLVFCSRVRGEVIFLAFLRFSTGVYIQESELLSPLVFKMLFLLLLLSFCFCCESVNLLLLTWGVQHLHPTCHWMAIHLSFQITWLLLCAALTPWYQQGLTASIKIFGGNHLRNKVI